MMGSRRHRLQDVTEKKTCEKCDRTTKYQGRIFHDLRRSAVRNMVQAGVAPQIAKRISGHATDSIFQRDSILLTDDLAAALAQTETYRRTSGSKVVAMGP
jgi:hypothetical protein